MAPHMTPDEVREYLKGKREPNYEILLAEPDEDYFSVERDLYAIGPDEAAEEFLRLHGPVRGVFGVRFKRLGGVTFYRSDPQRASVVHPALLD